MRTILKLALLTAALFTVACTEDPDVVDGDIAAATADEPTDLAIDGDIDTLSERQQSDDQGPGDRLADPTAPAPRGPAASGADSVGDRLSNPRSPRGAVLPGTRYPQTGVADCRTDLELHPADPAPETMSAHDLGVRSRNRAARLQLLGLVRR